MKFLHMAMWLLILTTEILPDSYTDYHNYDFRRSPAETRKGIGDGGVDEGLSKDFRHDDGCEERAGSAKIYGIQFGLNYAKKLSLNDSPDADDSDNCKSNNASASSTTTECVTEGKGKTSSTTSAEEEEYCDDEEGGNNTTATTTTTCLPIVESSTSSKPIDVDDCISDKPTVFNSTTPNCNTEASTTQKSKMPMFPSDCIEGNGKAYSAPKDAHAGASSRGSYNDYLAGLLRIRGRMLLGDTAETLRSVNGGGGGGAAPQCCPSENTEQASESSTQCGEEETTMFIFTGEGLTEEEGEVPEMTTMFISQPSAESTCPPKSSNGNSKRHQAQHVSAERRAKFRGQLAGIRMQQEEEEQRQLYKRHTANIRNRQALNTKGPRYLYSPQESLQLEPLWLQKRRVMAVPARRTSQGGRQRRKRPHKRKRKKKKYRLDEGFIQEEREKEIQRENSSKMQKNSEDYIAREEQEEEAQKEFHSPNNEDDYY